MVNAMMDVKAANPRGDFCTAPAPEGPESALDFVVLVIAVSLNPSSKPTICLVLLVVPRARAQSASMPMTISTVWYATTRRLQKCTHRKFEKKIQVACDEKAASKAIGAHRRVCMQELES